MRPSHRTGQPLATLALLMVSWVGARVLLWESPFAAVPIISAPPLDEPRPTPRQVVSANRDDRPSNVAALPEPGRWTAPPPPVWTPALPDPIAPRPDPVAGPAPQPLLSPRLGGGHQMLWMAAVAQLPMPADLTAVYLPTPQTTARSMPTKTRRWSADGWVLWRDGGTGFNLPGSGLPGAALPVGTYGASQYGAVLRYHLAPGSGHQPRLYLRGTGSVDRPRYQEAALGISARPVHTLPLSVHAELRVTRSFGETRSRPAAMLVTELPPARLPLGIRAEAYAQAGIVGGKGATPFVDGQVRLDRQLAGLPGAELRAGAGLWGGAQRGARRLDMGPSASLAFGTGGASARLSADWRFRVAGQAAPRSGPAITLSAGF